MIKIVSGDIDSGKSTWMFRDFSKHPDADGFICRKTFTGKTHCGYDLVHLRSGRRVSFIRKIAFIEADWQEACKIGEKFSFHRQGFSFADDIYNQAVSSCASSFYLDEIGHLELQNLGFADLLRKLLQTRMNLVIAVRETLLEQVIKHFSINTYQVIKPDKAAD